VIPVDDGGLTRCYTGSSIKHILITEDVAKKKQAPIYLARGLQHRFNTMFAAEEEEWEARRSGKSEEADEGMGSFEEYREKSKAAGVM
jgi:ATP-dependent Clp protease ATP-binding subunit ClpX